MLRSDANLDEALYEAVKAGNIERVRELLHNGAGVNFIDGSGRTSLHYAAENGHAAVVSLLLDRGVGINDLDLNCCTPLHYAAENGHAAVVSLLLERGAEINIPDDEGYEPLHCAVSNGHTEVIDLLLTKGAKVEVGVTESEVLQKAAEKGHAAVVEMLLDKEVVSVNDRDEGGLTLLHWVVCRGYVTVAKVLLDKGSNVDALDRSGRTPLYRAAGYGYTELVELLLNRGADINAKDDIGNTSLHRTVFRGYTEIVELLLEKGVDVNAQNEAREAPLHYAVSQGRVKMVEVLLNNRAEVNITGQNGRTPLHCAATQGSLEMVEVLLNNRAGVNIPDENGITPLHCAARNVHTRITEVLLDKGANASIQDKNGRTPLHWAAAFGNAEVTALLLNRGAEINATCCYSGDMPGLWEFTANHTGVGEMVVEHGVDSVDSNDTGKSDKTPLHLAAMEGCADVVELLLERGANVNAKDSEGYTPLRWAAHKGRVRVLELLLDNGANVDAFYGNIGNIGSKPLSVLVYFVGCLALNREGSFTRASNWIFHSQKCITIALNFRLAKKHEISEDKIAAFTRLINAAFNNIFAINRAVLAAIVVDNDNPKAQKAMFTCALKQYAMLLENREATTEQSQQLESDYTDIITAAVQANPNLYYIARAYCNSVDFVGEKTNAAIFNIVQSYLLTSLYTLHDGIKLETRARLLEVVKEALPQQSQVLVHARNVDANWEETIANSNKRACIRR